MYQTHNPWGWVSIFYHHPSRWGGIISHNSFKESWPNSPLCIGKGRKGLIQRIGKLKSTYAKRRHTYNQRPTTLPNALLVVRVHQATPTVCKCAVRLRCARGARHEHDEPRASRSTSPRLAWPRAWPTGAGGCGAAGVRVRKRVCVCMAVAATRRVNTEQRRSFICHQRCHAVSRDRRSVDDS